MGWTALSEFKWKKVAEKLEVDLNWTNSLDKKRPNSEKSKISHAIREGFCSWMWHRLWDESKRHELVLMRAVASLQKYPAARGHDLMAPTVSYHCFMLNQDCPMPPATTESRISKPH